MLTSELRSQGKEKQLFKTIKWGRYQSEYGGCDATVSFVVYYVSSPLSTLAFPPPLIFSLPSFVALSL